MPVRSIFAVTLLLALASTAWAGESCPPNSIHVSRTDVSLPIYTPTGSMVWTQSEGDHVIPWDASQPCPEGCYDLPNATLEARGSNYLYGPGDTGVDVADDYVVLGPAGSPLSFEVVLQLNATIDVEGTAVAEIQVAGSWSPTLERTATGQSQLAMPVVVAPGTPIEINAYVSAVGGHYDGTGLGVATFRFRGLPTGYVITSCQGYDQATPARVSTWGGVKARYR